MGSQLLKFNLFAQIEERDPGRKTVKRKINSNLCGGTMKPRGTFVKAKKKNIPTPKSDTNDMRNDQSSKYYKNIF